VYLVRISDSSGKVEVYEIDGRAVGDRITYGYTFAPETPRAWFYGSRKDRGPVLCGRGRAAIGRSVGEAFSLVYDLDIPRAA
jgi:hypothetical protein